MFNFTKCLAGVTLQLVGLTAFGAIFAGACIVGNIEERLNGDKQPDLNIV